MISKGQQRRLNDDKADAEWRQFNGEKEPAVCKKFGCGKHLTPEENLYSQYCIACQKLNNKQVHIIQKFISRCPKGKLKPNR